MAELILAVVALGVAGPGIVTSFAECGKHIESKIKTFKHAPEILIKVGTFGHDLHRGQLKENLSLVEWAYAQHDLDASLKSVLEDHIERLRQGLIELDHHLDRVFDSKGNINRVKFVFSGERNIRAGIKELDKWQQAFWGTISLIEMRKRVLPDPLLLTPNKFKLKMQQNGQFLHCLEYDSHLRVGKAELYDRELREVDVLIEPKRKITTSVNEIKEIAACLSQRPSENFLNSGVLQCLGYREEPKLELVFELPRGATQLRTLEDVIKIGALSNHYAHAGRHPLDHRYRLAYQISKAVLSVHTSNRVHKNIRPGTILMISIHTEEDSDSQWSDLGSPCLTDWTMLRSIDSPSSSVGENDWLTDIYRHPKRQGLQPEVRYNMGHDIYSLGVCLLVIGLWEPLVLSDGRSNFPSERYRGTALRLRLMTEGESDSLTKAIAANDAAVVKSILKKITRPLLVQKTLQALAEYELPSRMGLTYTKIVLACLSCLEDGLGNPEIMKGNDRQAIGLIFNQTVMQPLSALLSL